MSLDVPSAHALSRGERDVAEHFAERYGAEQSDASREIEAAVLGGHWGANGYTTGSQADVLGREVALAPSCRLLDLGAGRGWPGLFLAATSGCEAVLVDVPFAGIAAGNRRAVDEGIADRTAGVVASARHLPIRAASFDAIVHTDVMCCLRAKVTVLRECSRLLRPGGRVAFFTIHTAAGLSAAGRRRAARDGPPCVLAPRSYAEMLEAAGLTDVRQVDWTEEFATVAGAWIEQRGARRAELVAELGEAAFEDRQSDSRAQLRAVEDQLLKRSLLTARRPIQALRSG